MRESPLRKFLKVSPSDSLPFPISSFINIKEVIDKKINGYKSPIEDIEEDYDEFLNSGKTIPNFEPYKFN